MWERQFRRHRPFQHEWVLLPTSYLHGIAVTRSQEGRSFIDHSASAPVTAWSRRFVHGDPTYLQPQLRSSGLVFVRSFLAFFFFFYDCCTAIQYSLPQLVWRL